MPSKSKRTASKEKVSVGPEKEGSEGILSLGKMKCREQGYMRNRKTGKAQENVRNSRTE